MGIVTRSDKSPIWFLNPSYKKRAYAALLAAAAGGATTRSAPA